MDVDWWDRTLKHREIDDEIRNKQQDRQNKQKEERMKAAENDDDDEDDEDDDETDYADDADEDGENKKYHKKTDLEKFEDDYANVDPSKMDKEALYDYFTRFEESL